MPSIYDKAEIYDLGFDERKWQVVREHWGASFRAMLR